MDIYQIKWTRLQWEIFRLLCIKSGQGLNLRKMARLLDKSPTAVSNAIRRLEIEKYIKIKKADNMNLLYIELNRDNREVINMKRVENLRLVYESGLVNFLWENFPGTAIVLFGSYSRGEDVWVGSEEGPKSDIDIAVIGTKSKNIVLNEFEDKLERNISVNFYLSLKEIHKHLKDSIVNGIVLSGGIEL